MELFLGVLIFAVGGFKSGDQLLFDEPSEWLECVAERKENIHCHCDWNPFKECFVGGVGPMGGFLFLWR